MVPATKSVGELIKENEALKEELAAIKSTLGGNSAAEAESGATAAWGKYVEAVEAKSAERAAACFAEAAVVTVWDHSGKEAATFNGGSGAQTFFDAYFAKVGDDAVKTNHLGWDSTMTRAFWAFEATADGTSSSGTATIAFDAAGKIVAANLSMA